MCSHDRRKLTITEDVGRGEGSTQNNPACFRGVQPDQEQYDYAPGFARRAIHVKQPSGTHDDVYQSQKLGQLKPGIAPVPHTAMKTQLQPQHPTRAKMLQYVFQP